MQQSPGRSRKPGQGAREQVTVQKETRSISNACAGRQGAGVSSIAAAPRATAQLAASPRPDSGCGMAAERHLPQP